MPASTRSSTKQARIDDPKDVKAPVIGSKRKIADVASPARKRKTEPKKDAKPSKKPTSKLKANLKEEAGEAEEDAPPNDEEDDILINRAPVLELWAASVTHFQYPKLPWETCLSAGSAISTICAVSKGRAIGKIDPPDEQKRKERREQAGKDDLDEIEVMGFHLKLTEGQALVGEKPKKGNEDALKGKFGEEGYVKVKGAFEEVSGKWKGREEELDGRAFNAYEDFRPSVAKGQKGWGRKGMLRLQTVRDAVAPS